MAVVYKMENVYPKYKGEKNYANENISLDIKDNQIGEFYNQVSHLEFRTK